MTNKQDKECPNCKSCILDSEKEGWYYCVKCGEKYNESELDNQDKKFEEEIKEALFDFALTFASADDPEKGHWWGHDTDLGTCEEEFDLATEAFKKIITSHTEAVRREERERIIEILNNTGSEWYGQVNRDRAIKKIQSLTQDQE